ncbi:MAG: TlpA family protein disulfide reductase, partial [Fimbriimonadaceae bacterium]|nr:TlpA family protein disulfide reductase [Alphaproteobacteria bacterium]
MTGYLAGNGEDGPMSARTAKTLDAIRSLAVGEVAALAVAKEVNAVPTIGFIDGDGNAKRLEDWKNRLVLLNLWATWCGPCIREMPALDRLQERLGSDRFEVVAINVDKGGPGKGQDFYRELALQNLGYYYDNSSEKIFRQIRAFGMPTTLLVDGDG